ncbi:RNA polymerase sigma factor (TIGR02999 family) [Alteromonadaceae bacterium 2753L.S.0a.02]|nr:RNA polymerase sigma factor (TIGR02999 family) [Alteromonadaceae bacterium 2753L.S.0a.02]
MNNRLSTTLIANSDYHADQYSISIMFSRVYDELRRIASREKRRINNADTINTSALINEAYLKLASCDQLNLQDRAHFFAVAALAMRQVLVNYIEQKYAQKRGGDHLRVTLNSLPMVTEVDMVTLLSIDRALEQLATLDDKLAKLVEMRFFAGMSETEIACVLRITERTVRRNWRKARALLQQILDNSPQS